jgi:hypothetical protein
MTQDNARPRVEQYAEAIADTACDLADTTRSQDWNAASQDDLLEAIDTLAGALSALGPDIARALAAVTPPRPPPAGTSDSPTATATDPSLRRERWRRVRCGARGVGSGPGFKGIRTSR